MTIKFPTAYSSLLLPLCFLSACALNGAPTTIVEGEEKSSIDSPQGHATPGPVASSPQDNSDIGRLALLWHTRTQGSASDYPIGPGDIIDISVPAMEELRGHTVRVLGDGTISLPFLGKIQASGLTEEELREKIRERVARYMYLPRVITFVREHRNRQVAILGAVGRPGVYNLKSEADTILDVISQAGGISSSAESRIQLIPAERAENAKSKQIVSILPDSILNQDPSLLILKKTEPILIDLKALAYGGYQNYLSLPVRPGDVIMVPGGGQVLVEGWVEKPGAYSISPGLTVAGVVAAAGGPLFPAETAAVKVIRADRGGGKKSLLVDLEKIKSSKEQDIILHGGDIVEVSSAPGKLTLYGLYRFFTTVVNIGVGGNIPIFR